MLYINKENVMEMGIDWHECVSAVEEAVRCMANDDTAQPIKPYLRFRDLKNRIIAMPAFVGGKFDVAGIKWIASFPDNIHKNKPRANSVIILNKADSGEPFAILNTALISVIRTASVSGLLVKYFAQNKELQDLTVGITGWGPIGQHHYKMCKELLGDKVASYKLYDLREIDTSCFDEAELDKIEVVSDWESAYVDADIFMTCTVSKERYIDRKPKAGSLQLNVSLRDYKESVFEHVSKAIIVDEWEEICRENTDVEHFHKTKGLQKEDTRSIIDVVMNDCLAEYPEEQPVMFNPMGMAVFDMAIASSYYHKAKQMNKCTDLG